MLHPCVPFALLLVITAISLGLAYSESERQKSKCQTWKAKHDASQCVVIDACATYQQGSVSALICNYYPILPSDDISDADVLAEIKKRYAATDVHVIVVTTASEWDLQPLTRDASGGFAPGTLHECWYLAEENTVIVKSCPRPPLIAGTPWIWVPYMYVAVVLLASSLLLLPNYYKRISARAFPLQDDPRTTPLVEYSF